MQEHPLDDESEQFVEWTILDQLASDCAERLQLWNVAGVELLLIDLLDGDGNGRSRRGVGDRQNAIGVVLLGLENEFCVAKADAIAGA